MPTSLDWTCRDWKRETILRSQTEEGNHTVDETLGAPVSNELERRSDPYRSWLAGIGVEISAFVAFSVFIVAFTLLLVLLVGD